MPKKMKIRDRIKELRRVPGSQLAPNPKNWRTHPAAQLDALRGVLAEVGFAGAHLARELADGSLQLIDGHARAEIVGDAVVPVLVTDLSEQEADKILATFDPIGAMAGADTGKLAELLESVRFDSPAIESMLDSLKVDNGILADRTEVQEDEIPEAPADPITKPGDLWILGEHRLLCGDSTKAEDVARLMAGERADLCFTSPPYGQQRAYTKEFEEHENDWFTLMAGVFANLPMVDAGQVLVNLGLIHRDGEWMPYWDGWIDWMRSQGWRRFGWYVWDQGSGLPGDWNGRFAPSHEFVWHFNRKSERPQKTVATKDETRARKGQSVPIGFRKEGGSSACTSPDKIGQDFKIPDSVIRINRSPIDGKLHPATFPVALASFAMQSWPGVVYEPFSGSGTTLIAAEQLGRRCYAMELSPAYVDVAVKRWENLTGENAEKSA